MPHDHTPCGGNTIGVDLVHVLLHDTVLVEPSHTSDQFITLSQQYSLVRRQFAIHQPFVPTHDHVDHHALSTTDDSVPTLHRVF